MAIICRERKLIFIMVPGTACSVVGNALRSQLGAEWIPEKDIFEGQKRVVQRKHNSLTDLLKHQLITPEEREDYLVFAAVRNPFDRWVTYYQRYSGEWIDKYGAFAERQLQREQAAHQFSNRELQKRRQRLRRSIASKERRRSIIRLVGFNNWASATFVRKWIESRKGGSSLREFAFPMLSGVDVAFKYELLDRGLSEILRTAGIDTDMHIPTKNVTPGKKRFNTYYNRATRSLGERAFRKEFEAFGYSFDGPVSDEPLVWLSERKAAVPA